MSIRDRAVGLEALGARMSCWPPNADAVEMGICADVLGSGCADDPPPCEEVDLK